MIELGREIQNIIEAQEYLKQINFELSEMCNLTNFEKFSFKHYDTFSREKIRVQQLIAYFNSLRRPIGDRVSTETHEHLLKDKTMIIEFEEKQERPLTFSDVDDGQLFVDVCGNLYQKSCEEEGESWCICDSNGKVQGEKNFFSEHDRISRTLPQIKRILF